MMRNKQAITICIIIFALLLALPVHIFTRPSDGGIKIITTGGSSQQALDEKLDKTGGTITGNLNVDGTIAATVIDAFLEKYDKNRDGVVDDSESTQSLGGTHMGGTNTITIEATTPGKDIVLKTTGTGSTKLRMDTGTITLMYVPQVFTWNGTVTTQTGTTTESVMGQVTVPGGVVGTRGILRCRFALVSGTTTNYGQNPQLYVYDGVGTSTLYELNNNTAQSFAIVATLANTGSTSANVKYAGIGSSGESVSATNINSVVPFTVNTANQMTFTVTHHSSAGTTTSDVTTNLYDLRVETQYANPE